MLQFFRKFRLPVYEALILPFPSEVPNMQVSVCKRLHDSLLLIIPVSFTFASLTLNR